MCLNAGRTYVLLFKSVSTEDMGEIKFTAEKASSTAKLKVKGKQMNVLLCVRKSHNSKQCSVCSIRNCCMDVFNCFIHLIETVQFNIVTKQSMKLMSL